MSRNDWSEKKNLLEDEWGRDPSVRGMRQVFSYMEQGQQELLTRLNISFYDRRLRRGRDKALQLFEQAWPLAARSGIIANERDAGPFYIHCLARALSSVGIEIPDRWLPRDEKIIRLLEEKGL